MAPLNNPPIKPPFSTVNIQVEESLSTELAVYALPGEKMEDTVARLARSRRHDPNIRSLLKRLAKAPVMGFRQHLEDPDYELRQLGMGNAYAEGFDTGTKVQMRILELEARTDLKPWEKKKMMRELVREARTKKRELLGALAQNTKDIARAEVTVAETERRRDACERALLWVAQEPTVGRIDNSGLHRLSEAAHADRVCILIDPDPLHLTNWSAKNLSVIDVCGHAESILLQHNWAGAFQGATDFEHRTGEDVRAPYDITAFEMRLGGRHVILVGISAEANLTPTTTLMDKYLMFVDAGDGYWLGYRVDSGDGSDTRMISVAIEQARAACIALDAEVAVTEAIRAPEKLNRERERKGKPPLRSFHVVNLARRTRTAPLPDADQDPDRERQRRRMHFRRGHWRHYSDHRTWIRWMLVGDPDLGFVEKEYRL